MRDLSSPTRDRTLEPAPPAKEAQRLNHWTAREVPHFFAFETWEMLFNSGVVMRIRARGSCQAPDPSVRAPEQEWFSGSCS